MLPAGRNHDTSAGIFFGSSRKVGRANKGLGEAPKSCTRKEHESATNSIARRGQGAIAPCRVKGQRPLWGLGQRPNCSAGDQHRKRTQQRRRQRSVPAPNFARPQTRPQLLFPQASVMNLFFCLTASIRHDMMKLQPFFYFCGRKVVNLHEITEQNPPTARHEKRGGFCNG